MKRNTRYVTGLIIGLLIFSGCKPKQIITEKVIAKVDSTAAMYWQDQYNKSEAKNAILETDLERTKEENVNLLTEISKHEINYDTGQPIDPETGKPPVLKEVYTQTKSQFENTIKEKDIQLQEYRIEVENQENKISNLQYEVNSLRDENRELKEKTAPQTGFNFDMFFWGALIGMTLSVVIYIAIRKKIR